MQYDAMWKAYAHAWAPMIVTLAGAIVGGLIARRLLR
jgi:glycerol uptake facilitator-like aquaporin